MRIKMLARAAAHIAGLSVLLACTACAAPMGQVAGSVVGGAGWAVMKTGGAMFKGGKFAAKETGAGVKVAGRTVKGAASGVHQEFSESDATDSGQDQIGQLSQTERTTLPY